MGITNDFGLEEWVVEVVKMHVDIVGGDDQSQQCENKRSIEFILQ